MDADQDTNSGGTVITMHRPKTSIREALATPTVPQPAPHVIADEEEAAPPADDGERFDPLPRPGIAYKAHGTHTPKPQTSLFLIDPEYLPDGHAYANLQRCYMEPDKKAPGKGPVLVLDFTHAEVRFEGRKLFTLCHLIGLHKMPWVWQHPSPEEFRDDNATLIRKITVKVKER
jgi:hypothetical protein